MISKFSLRKLKDILWMVPVVWSLSGMNTCGPPVQVYSIHGEDGFWSDVSHLEPKYLFAWKKKIIGQNYNNNTKNK